LEDNKKEKKEKKEKKKKKIKLEEPPERERTPKEILLIRHDKTK
jgi:hypothetical protein